MSVREIPLTQVRVEGKTIWLGRHQTALEAARVYDAAALEHFGEFALTNEMLGLLPPFVELDSSSSL